MSAPPKRLTRLREYFAGRMEMLIAYGFKMPETRLTNLEVPG